MKECINCGAMLEDSICSYCGNEYDIKFVDNYELFMLKSSAIVKAHFPLFTPPDKSGFVGSYKGTKIYLKEPTWNRLNVE